MVKAETVLGFPSIQTERVRTNRSSLALPLPLLCLNDEICRKPEESRMLDYASGDQQIQEGSCDDKSGKHTDQDTQQQRGSEADDDTCAEVTAESIEHRTGDTGSNIRIAYGGPGAFPATIDG